MWRWFFETFSEFILFHFYQVTQHISLHANPEIGQTLVRPYTPTVAPNSTNSVKYLPRTTTTITPPTTTTKAPGFLNSLRNIFSAGTFNSQFDLFHLFWIDKYKIMCALIRVYNNNTKAGCKFPRSKWCTHSGYKNNHETANWWISAVDFP